MKVFLRANMASLIASLCDYLVTILFKQGINMDAVLAGVSGSMAGGIVHFYVCRNWVFKANGNSVSLQGRRYFIIWAGNLVMNASGLYILINFAGVHYLVSKIITSIAVAFFYNYPLQKLYVFRSSLVRNES
jgi:putative flippase GtrA